MFLFDKREPLLMDVDKHTIRLCESSLHTS